MGLRYLTLAAVVVMAAFAGMIGSASAATLLPFWLPTAELTVPLDAVPSNFAGDLGVNGLACVSAGNCVAVGAYPNSAVYDSTSAMVITETDGVWGAATELQYPGSSIYAQAGLLGVACTSLGNCEAVGQEGLVVTEANGVWANPTELSLPSAADRAGDGQLNSIACTSAGNCVAVGQYGEQTGPDQPMVASETNGIWAPAAALQLPGNANAAGGGQLNSVVCASVGSCVAVGWYRYPDGEQPMAASYVDGSWTQATEVPAPSDGQTFEYGEATAVACPGTVCVTVGNAGHGPWQANEVNGTWGQAQAVISSPAADTLSAIECPDAQHCVVGGSYLGPDGYEPLTLAESPGLPDQATVLALPANQASTSKFDQFANVAALACGGNGLCEAGGTYLDGADHYQPMVAASVPELTLNPGGVTVGPPLGAVGSAYSAQILAYGGSGDYTWSVLSGSLPPGLTLSPSTGVVSGTPTASGSWDFTVGVTDPGPPAQMASLMDGINVNPGTISRASTLADKSFALQAVITRAKLDRRTRVASFDFSAIGEAASFQCALVRVPSAKRVRRLEPRYRGCASPKRYGHLSAGKYAFYTRALSSAGADSSPAEHKFRFA